ncbi:MAG: DUF1206 domain-containing protein [Actinomycetota bacterium]
MGVASVLPRSRDRRQGVELLARLGLASVGVSFALVGFLALMAAFHQGGAKTDRQGALARVAHTGWGAPVLLVVAVGFAGYAIWRFVLAITGREVESGEKKHVLNRVGYAARGVFYTSLAIATVRSLFSGGASGANASQKHAATVLRWPGGAWLVGAIGVAFIAAGLFNGYRGITKKYQEKLKMWEVPKARERIVTVVAAFGLLTRMVLFAIIGWFLLTTAIGNDANKTIGLDGALQKLASQPYGRVLLGIVGIGLLAYAAFRGVEARYRTV